MRQQTGLRPGHQNRVRGARRRPGQDHPPAPRGADPGGQSPRPAPAPGGAGLGVRPALRPGGPPHVRGPGGRGRH